ASGTEVRELSAVLPGDAELDLAGHVASRRLTGVARLRAPALRTTLGWLQGAGFAGLTTLPPGVLRSAELAGQLRVGGGEIAVAGLDGSVDGAHLSGTLAARMAGRLALSAALRMERLDLDPWLPAALPTPSALGGSLHPFDVDLRLHADHAVAHGLDIAPLTLDAAASNGGLQLRNIAFASSNVRVSASGSIGAGGRLDDARFDLQASEAAPLLAMFATTPPDRAPALLRSPLHLQIAASGAPDAVAARVIADLGDLHAEAEPTVDLAGGRWTGPVALHHAGAPRLAESLGVIGAPAWLGDGSFALLATVAVTPNSVAASDLDLTAGALHATGQLAVDAGGAVPRVTGKLSAERLPLPLPYPRSPDPLPFGLLSGWEGQLAVRADHVLLDGGPFLDDAAAAIGLAAGRLSVDGLTARLAGGAASGRIKLDTQASPPSLAMDARVVGAAVDRLFELPIDLASGRLDGEASLRAAGFSARALLTTLQGSLTMHVADGSIAGLSLPPAGQVLSDSTVLASFAGGTTLFDALDVSAALGPGGILLQRGVLDSPAGAVRIAGAIDPVAQTADLRIVDRPAIADPPEIGLRLTGPLDALQRTPELARLAQWRASRPPLPDTSP
ncbi:MAG: AsmA family protein, partial [Acetobacteraceae bacterium]|nr:AsmA family protein [Acetobacteraceae bacterium]